MYRKLLRVFQIVLFIVPVWIFYPLSQLAKATDGSFTQSTWNGGAGQNTFSDAAKFSSSKLVNTATANQVTLAKALGTGADGDCIVSGVTILDGSTNNSCVGRSIADAVRFKISSNISAGSRTVNLPKKLSVNPVIQQVGQSDGSFFDESQTWFGIGSDGFVRMLYLTTNYTEIHFVQCTNADCTTKNTSVISSEPVNYTDSPSMVFGTDGLPLIVFDTYENPGKVYLFRCTNASCSTGVKTTIDTGGSGHPNFFYEPVIQLGSDGFPRISYDNYNGSMPSEMRYVQCLDVDCTSKNMSVIDYGDAGNDYIEPSYFTLSPDDKAHFVYYITHQNKIFMVKCNDASCSSRTKTAIVTGAGSFPKSSIKLNSQGLPRIVVNDQTNGLLYIACTNADCSAKTTTQLQLPNNYSTIGFDLTADDLGRFVHKDFDGNLEFFVCQNVNCSDYAATVLVLGVSSTVSLVKAGNEKYALAYSDAAYTNLSVATVNISYETPTELAPGDEIFVMDTSGTSSDFSNVGTYETRYIKSIDGSTLTLDTPLNNSYDASSHTILLQRIPNYSSVTLQAPGTPTSTGLVGYWKFDEGTGTTASDTTASGMNGTLTNNVTWTEGLFGKGVSFLGAAAHNTHAIELGDRSELELQTGTFSAWIYRKGSCSIGTCTILSKGESGWHGFGFEIANNSGYRLRLSLEDDHQHAVGNTIINTDRWYHVAATFDNSTIKLYVNGALDATIARTVPTISYDAETASIGNRNDNRDLGFNGTIDELRAYDRVLSPSEISVLASFPVLTATNNDPASGKGGVLFFRSTGAVTVPSGGSILMKAKGFPGGAWPIAQGLGKGGYTYNGQGGNGNGGNGQGGGGGAGIGGQSPGTVSKGGAGGGGGHYNTSRGGGGGGAGYATVGSGVLNYNGTQATAGSGALGGNGGVPVDDSSGGGGGGGGTYGSASLDKVFLGSGGGAGGNHNGTDGPAGAGGSGGGVIIMYAASLTNAGIISANGDKGGDGWLDSAGGGGGSGGSIKIVTSGNASLGTSSITASGGSAGIGALNGGSGGSGRIAVAVGGTASGTTSPASGSAAPLGYASSGTILSSVYDTGQSSDWGSIQFSATKPAATNVHVKVRSSNSPTMSGASNFSSCNELAAGNDISLNNCVHDTDRYVQYQVQLTTSDPAVTPTLTGISIAYALHLDPTPTPTPTAAVTPTPTATPKPTKFIAVPVTTATPTPTNVAATPTETDSNPVDATPTTSLPTPTAQPTHQEDRTIVKILKVVIKDKAGKPLAFVKVTLHSTPRTATTDKDGVATFTNVEVGQHTIDYEVAGKSYSQKLAVVYQELGNKGTGSSGPTDVQEVHVVAEERKSSSVWLLIVLVFVVFGAGIVIWRKKRPSLP